MAYDYGIKENILRLLRQKGFAVTVVPASTPAEKALSMNPDGIFLSNGPGDPASMNKEVEEIRQIIEAAERKWPAVQLTLAP